MRRITDPDFRYVPSAKTDISATFRRVRKRLQDEAEARAKDEAERKNKVKAISGRKG